MPNAGRLPDAIVPEDRGARLCRCAHGLLGHVSGPLSGLDRSVHGAEQNSGKHALCIGRYIAKPSPRA